MHIPRCVLLQCELGKAEVHLDQQPAGWEVLPPLSERELYFVLIAKY